MHIECRLIAELPFNLNLPDGAYEVRVGAVTVTLHVLQKRFAAHMTSEDRSRFLIISESQAAEGIAGEQPVFYQRLRTVIELHDEANIPPEEMHVPTPKELVDEMSRTLILQGLGLAGASIETQAEAQLAALLPEQMHQFAHVLGRKLTARNRVPSRVSVFMAALNTLVRLYMARFDDFFVEEVAFHQLGGTVTSGVMIVWVVDGEVVNHVAHAEKIPPLMRGQWFDHGEPAIVAFRTALSDGTPPDSVTLLRVRAKALLERGAYRSAIIEASAALETTVTRKIHRGLVAAGKSEAEIATVLKAHERFGERAKKLLKQVTGSSAAELDAILWHRVLQHRDRFRHRIAHSDLEPARGEAEAAVEHFARLAELIVQIP